MPEIHFYIPRKIFADLTSAKKAEIHHALAEAAATALQIRRDWVKIALLDLAAAPSSMRQDPILDVFILTGFDGNKMARFKTTLQTTAAQLIGGRVDFQSYILQRPDYSIGGKIPSAPAAAQRLARTRDER
ncbi:MAG: hypothetical protein AB7G80_00510 [Dongiaceae bacterium]